MPSNLLFPLPAGKTMAASGRIPPLPPASGPLKRASSFSCSPSRLLIVASGLPLGRALHLHATRRLQRLLFCPSAALRQELLSMVFTVYNQQAMYHPDHLMNLDGFGRCFLLEISTTLGSITNSFWSCSSFVYLSSAKGSEKGSGDEEKVPFETPEGNFPKKRNNQLWTNVLLAVNILLYGAQILTEGKLTLWGAKVNGLIDQGQIWRLVTSSFLHANPMHLMVNSYSLNSIGPPMEKISGSRRFLAIYFASAIASSILSYRFCQSPSLGASGAIFGLVGSLAVFVLRHRKFIGGGKDEMQQIANVIALNMAIGLLSGNTDNWGHVGGLLGGAAISWFLGPAWSCEYKADDRKVVFADRAPVFRFMSKQRKQ